MRFVSWVQNDSVKVGAGRLVADILVDPLFPQLVQADGVGERFAAGLESELRVDGPKGEPGIRKKSIGNTGYTTHVCSSLAQVAQVILPLPVHCTDAHRPVVFTDFCQLGDVGGYTAVVVLLAGEVDLLQLSAQVLQPDNATTNSQ